MPDVHAGLTVGALLERTAHRYPAKTALVYEGRRLLYRELDEAANRCAHGLIALGAKRDTRIALLARNSDDWVVAHFGVARTGATLVPVNFLFVEREIEYVLDNAQAEILIVAAEFQIGRAHV